MFTVLHWLKKKKKALVSRIRTLNTTRPHCSTIEALANLDGSSGRRDPLAHDLIHDSSGRAGGAFMRYWRKEASHCRNNHRSEWSELRQSPLPAGVHKAWPVGNNPLSSRTRKSYTQKRSFVIQPVEVCRPAKRICRTAWTRPHKQHGVRKENLPSHW